MSIQRAEELKREWTDKHVIIRPGVPELKRFDGLVGRVRTVNMNCRLLIEFDTPADISWYDVDPLFVTIVDSGPTELSRDESVNSTKSGTNTAAAVSATTDETTAVSVAADASVSPPGSAPGMSPLDQIRKQAAAAAAPGGPVRPSVVAPDSKVSQASGLAQKSTAASPLDQIRQQAAAGKSTAATGAAVSDSPAQVENVQKSSPATRGASDTSVTVSADDAGEASTTMAQAASGDSADGSVLSFDGSNPFDQIRAQAAGESVGAGNSHGTPSIFDHIRAQAAADEPDTA